MDRLPVVGSLLNHNGLKYRLGGRQDGLWTSQHETASRDHLEESGTSHVKITYSDVRVIQTENYILYTVHKYSTLRPQ